MSVSKRNNNTILKNCRRLALGACGRVVSITGKYILLPVFLMCAAIQQQGHAQVAPAKAVSNFKPAPLAIGDKIPDELWNLALEVVNHPEGKKTITLSEYKGKLIILDFWATYCSPCIRNFPRLHALQNEFGEKLKVLAVTSEALESINKFFSTGAGKNYTYANSVVADEILSDYFPHLGVPYIVWISPKNTVLNTTRTDEVTNDNIQAILENKNTKMATRIDIDTKRPLFLSEHFDDKMELKNYSIFAKGFYPGLPSGGDFRRDSTGKVYGRQITNLPIMDIYLPILYHVFERNGEAYNSKRAIIRVKEPAQLKLIKRNGVYETDNYYSYELIVPKDKADSLYYFMLNDLNRNSDYIATIEKRTVDCLILVRSSNRDKMKSKGGGMVNRIVHHNVILYNAPLSHMLNNLNEQAAIDLPIIDETNYTNNVDIEISNVTSLSNLKKGLNRYDLDLKEEKRNILMFVLKDK